MIQVTVPVYFSPSHSAWQPASADTTHAWACLIFSPTKRKPARPAARDLGRRLCLRPTPTPGALSHQILQSPPGPPASAGGDERVVATSATSDVTVALDLPSRAIAESWLARLSTDVIPSEPKASRGISAICVASRSLAALGMTPVIRLCDCPGLPSATARLRSQKVRKSRLSSRALVEL